VVVAQATAARAMMLWTWVMRVGRKTP
jgi:hypothetical protein